MSIEQVLYRAHAKATGGRDGRAVVAESNLDLKLTTPKALAAPAAMAPIPNNCLPPAIAPASSAR